MTGRSEITLQAPATIANLGPGFDVFALALAAPCDHFRIRKTGAKGITVKVTDCREGLPTEAEKNTAGVAALHFLKTVGVDDGAEIEIIKRMPIGTGLGSSAASAVAAAYGLDRLFDTGLSDLEIIDIASQGEVASGGAAHADNASACALGGFVLIRDRHPLCLERIEIPEIPIVVRVRKRA